MVPVSTGQFIDPCPAIVGCVCKVCALPLQDGLYRPSLFSLPLLLASHSLHESWRIPFQKEKFKHITWAVKCAVMLANNFHENPIHTAGSLEASDIDWVISSHIIMNRFHVGSLYHKPLYRRLMSNSLIPDQEIKLSSGEFASVSLHRVAQDPSSVPGIG